MQRSVSAPAASRDFGAPVEETTRHDRLVRSTNSSVHIVIPKLNRHLCKRIRREAHLLNRALAETMKRDRLLIVRRVLLGNIGLRRVEGLHRCAVEADRNPRWGDESTTR